MEITLFVISSIKFYSSACEWIVNDGVFNSSRDIIDVVKIIEIWSLRW